MAVAPRVYMYWAMENGCADLYVWPWHGYVFPKKGDPWFPWFPLMHVQCPASFAFNHSSLAAAAPSVPVRNADDDKKLLKQLRSWLDDHRSLTCCDPAYQYHEEAYSVLVQLADVNARDILAFQETWSDLDTELLLQLDGKSRGFYAEGALTTEAFLPGLRSARAFADIVAVPGKAAIVGSGGALLGEGLGPVIDAHSTVVRFNDLVGKKLSEEDTGLRTTIHVSCSKVDTIGDYNISEFDMETAFPLTSYCNKMYRGGRFAASMPTPFFIRPSAFCGMGPDIGGFTRGFMFYWFIGRLFEAGVDMYGFSGSDHFQQTSDGDAVVHERYLQFEHLVYDLALGNNVTRRIAALSAPLRLGEDRAW